MIKGLLGKVVSAEISPGYHEHVFSPLRAPMLPSFTVHTVIEDMAQAWIGCTFS